MIHKTGTGDPEAIATALKQSGQTEATNTKALQTLGKAVTEQVRGFNPQATLGLNAGFPPDVAQAMLLAAAQLSEATAGQTATLQGPVA